MAVATATPAAAIAAPQKLRLSRLARASAILVGLVTLGAIFIPMILPASDGLPSPKQFLPPGIAGSFARHGSKRPRSALSAFHRRAHLAHGRPGRRAGQPVLRHTYGIIAGYNGGKLDGFMMRVVDVFYAVPRLIFIMLLAYVARGADRATGFTPIFPARGSAASCCIQKSSS